MTGARTLEAAAESISRAPIHHTAHAMEDGRSILMLRSTRDAGGTATSNIVWEYPATTIPRGLRERGYARALARALEETREDASSR